MKSLRTRGYKRKLLKLPAVVQTEAGIAFSRWTENTKHPGLNFECVDEEEEIWSVRVGIHYRALCRKEPGPIYIWFWIGSHAKYDKLI